MRCRSSLGLRRPNVSFLALLSPRMHQPPAPAGARTTSHVHVAHGCRTSKTSAATDGFALRAHRGGVGNRRERRRVRPGKGKWGRTSLATSMTRKQTFESMTASACCAAFSSALPMMGHLPPRVRSIDHESRSLLKQRCAERIAPAIVAAFRERTNGWWTRRIQAAQAAHIRRREALHLRRRRQFSHHLRPSHRIDILTHSACVSATAKAISSHTPHACQPQEKPVPAARRTARHSLL